MLFEEKIGSMSMVLPKLLVLESACHTWVNSRDFLWVIRGIRKFE